MEQIVIKRYDPSQAARWNDFCRTARNATFLFNRGFMDYHADRFTDFSLMALSGSGRIIALLPADIRGTTLRSHGGLTYGGWIIPARHFNGSTMLRLWESSLEMMRASGIEELRYKPLPWIYADRPSEDDRYALFRFGAKLEESLLSSTIDMRSPGPFNESTRQSLKLAASAGVTVAEAGISGLPEFWRMLERCLAERHDGVRPVHTLAEMTMLMERFPTEIRLFAAYGRGGEMMAGTLLFDTPRVAHTQYIATTPEGRAVKAFPPIVRCLLDGPMRSRAYFDFGTSCLDGGRYLNEGLLLQKSGMGAGATVYETYSLKL